MFRGLAQGRHLIWMIQCSQVVTQRCAFALATQPIPLENPMIAGVQEQGENKSVFALLHKEGVK